MVMISNISLLSWYKFDDMESVYALDHVDIQELCHFLLIVMI